MALLTLENNNLDNDGGYGSMDTIKRFNANEFFNLITANNASANQATESGLKLLYEAGYNPSEAAKLWNDAFGTKFTAEDYTTSLNNYGIAKGDKPQLAVFGDSISSSVGYALDGKGGGYSDTTYGNNLAQYLGQSLKVNAVNNSMGGTTSSDSLSGTGIPYAGSTLPIEYGDFASYITNNKPETALLRFGAADAIRLNDPATTLKNIESMVKLSKDNGTKPILVGVTPFAKMGEFSAGNIDAGITDSMIDSANAINQGIKDLADKYGVQFIDVRQVPVTQGALLDGVHPSAEYGAALNDYIASQIKTEGVFNQPETKAAEQTAMTTAPAAITPTATAITNKTSSIDYLTQQILGQNTTDKWSGEGYGGAEANAKAIAKLLDDAGITDIKQFGKVDKYEPVEVIGYTLNGKAVQSPSAGKYYEQIPEPDGEGGISGYRTRYLTPEEIAQVKTQYGVIDTQTDEVKPASNVVERDGKLVGVTGQTFGNKVTGQAINRGSGRWEQQGGEDLFSGTGEGEGNTAFRAQFDAQGNPVFYTTKGSSSDAASIMPFVQLALAATGAGGLLGNALLGAGASQIAAGALGNAIIGGATSALAGGDWKKGALLGGAGGALSGYLQGGPIDASNMTPAQFNDALESQLIGEMQRSGLTNAQITQFLENASPADITSITSALPVTGASDNLLINVAKTPITATDLISTLSQVPTVVTTAKTPEQVSPDVLSGVTSTLSGGNVTTPTVEVTDKNLNKTEVPVVTTPTVTDVINTIASTLPTTTPEQVITGQAPTTTNQDIINSIISTIPTTTPTTTPIIPEQVITEKAPTTTVQDVINTITATIPTTIPTTTPITTTAPKTETTTEKDKDKSLGVSDAIRLAQIGTTIAALTAIPDSGGPTQYDIVPVPESWTTPTITGTTPSTLPPINFGNRNLLIGTQWEKFLDPNYGKIPTPVQYSQPSNLSYSDLMGILGSKSGMPSASSLSINDIISGIQNQYGQTPRSTMG